MPTRASRLLWLSGLEFNPNTIILTDGTAKKKRMTILMAIGTYRVNCVDLTKYRESLLYSGDHPI